MKGFLSTIGFFLIVIATLGIAWFSVSAVRFENGLNHINQVGGRVLGLEIKYPSYHMFRIFPIFSMMLISSSTQQLMR